MRQPRFSQPNSRPFPARPQSRRLSNLRQLAPERVQWSEPRPPNVTWQPADEIKRARLLEPENRASVFEFRDGIRRVAAQFWQTYKEYRQCGTCSWRPTRYRSRARLRLVFSILALCRRPEIGSPPPRQLTWRQLQWLKVCKKKGSGVSGKWAATGDLGSPTGGPPLGATWDLPGLQRSEPGHRRVCVLTPGATGVNVRRSCQEGPNCGRRGGSGCEHHKMLTRRGGCRRSLRSN
ncbi:NAD(P)-linked oxidoreductase superfamily protein [Striga asiatica]|uniref:NAD(P)-linked oxidoreductase superfamily protein n=1 Tax=Striga asiatica TaxID=4170 RepID=A0A5A7QLS9_STRAF|nr:NAD(P)-linked oxidoreductase superfamily protein [Striga asiatica]